MEKIIQNIKVLGNRELKDIYIVNEQSHTVYYVSGVNFDGNIYYTTQGTYTKVELPSINSITE